MSSMDYEEAFLMGKQEIQEVVSVLSEKYPGGIDPNAIEQAIIDMGIGIDKGSEVNGIEIKNGNEVIFNVDGETFDDETVNIILIRLLGVYLFTNELNNSSFFEDTTMDPLSEEMVNYFMVIISIPEINVGEHILIRDLVKWSIETRIPLQVLKSTLL